MPTKNLNPNAAWANGPWEFPLQGHPAGQNGPLLEALLQAILNRSEWLRSALEAHTAATSPHPQYLLATLLGQASGVAPLDPSGLIPSSHIPPLALVQPHVVASQAAMLGLAAQPGDVAIRSDLGKTYILQSSPASELANWLEILALPAVSSVFGRTGAVVGQAGDYGIAHITGLQAALDGKAALAHNHQISDVVGLQSALSAPALPGALVRRMNNQLIPNDNVYVPIGFTVAQSDLGGFWNPGFPTRLTVPAGLGGTYRITIGGNFEPLTTGQCQWNIWINGNTGALHQLKSLNIFGTLRPFDSATTSLLLNAGDYVEFCPYQATGGPRLFGESNTGYPYMSIARER